MGKQKEVTCAVCSGKGYIWNPDTRKWDIPCNNCNTKGYILVPEN